MARSSDQGALGLDRAADVHGFAEPSVDITVAPTFERFYAEHVHELVAIARALAGSRAQAEDLAQEAMLAAYRRWSDIAALEHPEAWVRRVCANMAKSQFRRTMTEFRALTRLGGRRERQADPPDSGEHDAFWEKVRRLPKRQAQAVALHYVMDLTVVDVALTMGCSEGSVKVHLQRARHTLAEHMGEGESS